MSRMNPHVQVVADALLQQYEQRRAALKDTPAPLLLELEHEMGHLRLHPDFSIRSGAEIVRAAAVMERESRS